MKTTGTPFTSPNFSWILWAQNYTGWFQVNVEAFLHFLPISKLRGKKGNPTWSSRGSAPWISADHFHGSSPTCLWPQRNRIYDGEPKLCSTISSTTRMQIYAAPPFVSPFCLMGSCQTSHICRSYGRIDQRSPHRTCFYLLIGRRSKCRQLLFQDHQWPTIFRPTHAAANNEDW